MKDPGNPSRRSERKHPRGEVGYLNRIDRLLCKARYGNVCLCCGRGEPDIELTIDHIVPLAEGGNDHPDNWQPLCRTCNRQKGRQTIDYRKRKDRRV